MSYIFYSLSDVPKNYVEVASIDESEGYDVDITEIFYNTATDEWLLLTASGCSCWGGEYDEQAFNNLEDLITSMTQDDRQYNPSFRAAQELADKARDSVFA